MPQKTIGFYSSQLCVRGTEVAIYDYAHYNETILGNKSVIFHNGDSPNNDVLTVKKFSDRFPVIPLVGGFLPNSRIADGAIVSELLNKEIKRAGVDALYIIKCGYKSDGILPTACKTLIHCIGTSPPSEKHGDVYAYGSYWLSEHCSNGAIPAVPYMVDLPEVSDDLRLELGIPENAIVFGRNGGADSFDIYWAKQVVAFVTQNRNDVYFLFQNTDKFYDHPRIIHLPSNPNLDYKVKFINTCDAMIHAREIGESFGLSCGEFSIRNKPVITWYGSQERNHIYILGDRGIYYNNPQELFDILMSFQKQNPCQDFNCYREYSPERVMKTFKSVFLDG